MIPDNKVVYDVSKPILEPINTTANFSKLQNDNSNWMITESALINEIPMLSVFKQILHDLEVETNWHSNLALLNFQLPASDSLEIELTSTAHRIHIVTDDRIAAYRNSDHIVRDHITQAYEKALQAMNLETSIYRPEKEYRHYKPTHTIVCTDLTQVTLAHLLLIYLLHIEVCLDTIEATGLAVPNDTARNKIRGLVKSKEKLEKTVQEITEARIPILDKDYYKRRLLKLSTTSLQNDVDQKKATIHNDTQTIRQYETEINKLYAKLELENHMLNGMLQTLHETKDSTELYDYLNTSKALYVLHINLSTLLLGVTAPVSYWGMSDEEAEQHAKESTRFQNAYPLLTYLLTNQERYTLHFSNLVSLNTSTLQWIDKTNGDLGIRIKEFASLLERPVFPNPHHAVHQCYGQASRDMKECLQNRDFIGFFETLIMSTGTLNILESATLDPFENQITQRWNDPTIWDKENEEFISFNDLQHRKEQEQDESA
jgi:hypothetical protein